MNKILFEKAVKREFKYLLDSYGFSAPKTIDYGREIFVKFERDAQEVSISMEIGSAPIVEIFYPIEDIEDKPTPWAEKNGVQRARRFPRIKIEAKYSETPEDSGAKYIREMAEKLEKVELEWLTA